MNILADKFLNLLRSQGIPAGFCFQHLTLGEPILAFPCRPEYDEYFFEGIYAASDTETMKLLENAKDIKEVAETSIKLAHRFDADADICYKSALLHDISAIIKHEDMTLVAERNNISKV